MSASALWQAYQVAAATGGVLHGAEDWTVSSLSIDTRTLAPGALFVALQDQRDGHDFVAQAFANGAAAALVSKPVEGGPFVLVEDTLAALERLAAASRDRSFAPLIGVTGSAGKTTTKEMLRAALAPMGQVHAAEKSFNNHIGVPLTLSELPASAKVGVFEMGMNHAGEIRGLTKLVRPHIALITTVAEAHLENLGSIEAIADAKAEIAEGVRPGGVMILPGHSPHLAQLQSRCRNAGVSRILTFGEGEHDTAITSADCQAAFSDVTLSLLGTEVSYRLHVTGAHHVGNSAAALTAAVLAGADPHEAAGALEAFRPGAGRGEELKVAVNGAKVLVLDESYNANPASIRAALAVLGSKAVGRKIAVLGEMKELGPTSPELHAGLAPETAAYADLVFTAGDDMERLREAIPEEIRASHAANAIDLLEPLLEVIKEGDTVLFKGSNASRVGALVKAFCDSGRPI